MSRYDGLSSWCADSQNKRARANYHPKPRPKAGRRYVEPRNGDKKQARRRVNHLVEMGLLPRPGLLACVDCEHTGDDKRHEYDHYLGYSENHHDDVQVVCSSCHRKRAIVRNEWPKRR